MSDVVLHALQLFVLTYIVALPFGVVALVLCRQLRLLSWWWAALAGFAVTLIVFGPFLINRFLDGEVNNWYKRALALDFGKELLFGGFVGVTVWVLGVWRNRAMIRKLSDSSSEPSAP